MLCPAGQSCHERRGRGARVAALLVATLLGGVACRGGGAGPQAAEPVVDVVTAAATRQAVTRLLRVTGTLMAYEEAEVAAETTGRVVETPVERGSAVVQGSPLIVLSATEAEASAQEAEANVAQIEVRLGVADGQPFDAERVPEVSNARASRDLAAAEFERIRKLFDERVVSTSEFDQRRTQAEATQRAYETARNNASQLYRSLEASRARLKLARKALADTVVRSPFAGVVVERKVSTGDFVTRGTKVATVVRTNPLRVELSVPEQSVAAVKTGEPMALAVEAYPGRSFEGRVRFVSPSVRADQRALVVEALVPNPDGLQKPGMVATATNTSAEREDVVVVPTDAIRNLSGSFRVYVVSGDRVEERVITPGQVVEASTEVGSAVAEGEELARTNLALLSDGARIRVVRPAGPGQGGAVQPR